MGDRLIKFSFAACLVALLAPASLAQTNATQSTTPAPPPFGRHMGRRGMAKQGRGENPLKEERGEQRALRRLNLTDAQRQQMRDIEQRYGQTLRADREELQRLKDLRQSGGKLTPEQQSRARQLRQELRANAEKMRADINNILTPEQREQLKKTRDEMKERRRERANPQNGNVNKER
jgi:Spy/CpxP family protein refolding chaperone